MLDAGAGAGIYERVAVSKGYEYFGIDIKPRSPDVQFGDVTDIPFPSNRFDVVISVDVIEEVEDDLKALKEMHRVLKPRGVLLLHTPNVAQTHILVQPVDNPNHVRRGYTMDELRFLLGQAGFLRATLHPTFNWAEALAWEMVYGSNHSQTLDVYRLVHFDVSKFVPLGILAEVVKG